MNDQVSNPVSVERRFQLLVDAIAEYAIFMIDPDGIVTSWNAGAQRIKGYTRDEVLGRHFSMFFTPEDRAAGRPARRLEQASGPAARGRGLAPAQGRQPLLGPRRHRRDPRRDRDADRLRQGHPRHDRAAGGAGSAAGERAPFRLLVDGVADYAIYMLDPQGRVTNWNSGAERIKGYAADEIVGEHFSRFYTEEDRRAGVPTRALEQAAAEGRFATEGWRVRSDGSRFWATVVIDAIRDEDGSLIGFAKVTRDITEQRERSGGWRRRASSCSSRRRWRRSAN